MVITKIVTTVSGFDVQPPTTQASVMHKTLTLVVNTRLSKLVWHKGLD